MIKINVNKKKTVEFDVNVTGIQCDHLAGRLSLFYEGVIYSFPAEVETGNVLKVVIPPLNGIINNIPDKAQGDLKLEVIGNETFMMPWTGSAILEHPVKVKATMRGKKLVEDEEVKVDVEQIREKEEVVEKKKEKKEPKNWTSALLKAAKEPVKRKKKSKIGEALSGDKEDKERRKLKNKKLGEELAEALLKEGKDDN